MCFRSRWSWYRRRRSKLQQLALHLIERETVGWDRRFLWLNLSGELRDGLFQIGIVARERERRAILRERFLQFAAAMMDFSQAADRGQVLGCVLEDVFELALRIFELIQLEEGASERNACGKVAGVYREAGAAGLDRFLELAGPPELLGELRKSNRRRILLDPASKVFDTRIVSHPYGMTVTTWAADVLLSSVTVSVTVNVALYVPAGTL